ncbi:MAG TPA: hydrogenase maturation nickel metallochaperone HypA [Acidisphaera sp.]|nr:hydrogenase maturation nickel metallochaperone HypA [Acidisphaera sp.]
MHELSVCRSLLREAQRVAEAHRASGVTGIVVAVGPLSGIDGALLARAFEVARLGTIAEAAELEIETVPVVVSCAACGIDSTVKPNALLCRNCGAWQVDLRSGNELLLKRLELETSEEPAEAGR